MHLKEWLRSCKPGAPVSVHLLVAALIWSVVGIFLMTNGYLLLDLAGETWLVFPGLVAGTVKAIYILDRVARRNIERLIGMSDGACLGSVYSLKTWLLVGMMIGFGRLLRKSVLPGEVIGVVYLAVGWGLLLASRRLWRQRFIS